MRFCELVDDVSWNEVKESLIKFYDFDEESLLSHGTVFCKLDEMEPEEYNMRICVQWIEPDVTLESEGYWAVDGMNGTLQKESGDYEHFKENCTEEFSNSEIGYALDFTSWAKWLSMEIDPETANNINLMKSDIVALCLYEMTFMGYEEEDIQDKMNVLSKRVEEIENMTEEERDKKLITLEEMKKRIKKLGEDVNEQEGQEDD